MCSREDRYRLRWLHAQVLQGGPAPARMSSPNATRSRPGPVSRTDGWAASPDYKAAFLNTLGANAEFYGPFARQRTRLAQAGPGGGALSQHALVNPPIDRNKPVEEVKDVYITVQKETDAGIFVSAPRS